jgi:molybdopterin converting factor small subunit
MLTAGDEEGSAAVQVRVRLGAGLSRLSHAPLLTVELADGATVDDVYARLHDTQPDLAGALRSALPVIAGEHAARDRRLKDRDELALLLPVSGG